MPTKPSQPFDYAQGGGAYITHGPGMAQQQGHETQDLARVDWGLNWVMGAASAMTIWLDLAQWQVATATAFGPVASNLILSDDPGAPDGQQGYNKGWDASSWTMYSRPSEPRVVTQPSLGPLAGGPAAGGVDFWWARPLNFADTINSIQAGATMTALHLVGCGPYAPQNTSGYPGPAATYRFSAESLRLDFEVNLSSVAAFFSSVTVTMVLYKLAQDGSLEEVATGTPFAVGAPTLTLQASDTIALDPSDLEAHGVSRTETLAVGVRIVIDTMSGTPTNADLSGTRFLRVTRLELGARGFAMT